MAQFLNIFGLLAVILRAATLVFQSLIIGGMLFSCVVFERSHRDLPETGSALKACERLLRLAGLALAVSQTIYIVCESLILHDSAALSISEIAGANFVIAGLVLIACGLFVAFFPYGPRRGPWLLLPISAVILASTVATSHAFSRVESRIMVVALTALHLTATACWIGSLPYLLVSLKKIADVAVERTLVERYSRIALLSVGVLIASGVGTALYYVDSFSALYGTAYGLMLLGKALLLAVLLVLGAFNRSIIGRGDSVEIRERLRQFVAAEIGIGMAVILTAASMTSQPPAIDMAMDRVEGTTILNRLKPDWPRLRTPSQADLSPATRPLEKAAAAKAPSSFIPGGSIGSPNTPGDIAWSEYNHNWMGLLLVIIGVLATISRTGRLAFTRHWPLVFLLMGVFIFLRADPENWPLGPNGFWESFDQSEVLQHRLAVLLVIAFAFFEWRVQLGKTKLGFAPLVFPAVCVLGGMLLLTHTHALGNVKEELLAEMSHLPLALLAIIAGWARWLQLKLPTRDQTTPAWIWSICFALMGTILLIYREA